MKKIFKIMLIATACISGFIQPTPILANEAETSPETRADIIDWRYKSINGKLYKRLYNYSKAEWIGDWIRC